MKVYLSQVWRDRAKVMLLVITFYLVGPFIFNIYYPSSGTDAYWLFIPSFMLAWLGYILVLKGDIRRLTHVIIEEHQFTAYSVFNRELYTLDLTKPVYYGIFKAKQDLFYINDFIALSNEPFKFEDDKDWRYFIVRYDLKALLVMPYNDKTKPMMQIKNWKRIYNINMIP